MGEKFPSTERGEPQGRAYRIAHRFVRTNCLWGVLIGLGIIFGAVLKSAGAEPVSNPESVTRSDGDTASPENDILAEDRTSSGEEDLFNLDIEQLGEVDVVVPEFNLEVTSVTKSESTVGKSPAAIFVITPEMIRRSGAKTIPEVLRMAPGMNVARITHNTWAVSSRGFNDQFSNKLLVLIDGRSVYTPFFAGVHWDQQDVVLEDVARIEVIRGPGSSLWGANAVNGVVNIITKTAEETQGLLISSGGGSEDKAINTMRYGDKISDNAWFRVYGKQFERDTGFLVGGADDDWRQQRAGFRLDWLPGGTDTDRVTVQGDVYDGVTGNADQTAGSPGFGTVLSPSDTFIRGQNVLARWTHRFSSESSFNVQSYYDSFTRNGTDLKQTVDTFDVELTHRFPIGPRHDLTWGMQYRLIQDDLGFPLPELFRLDPDHRTIHLYSAFIQDRMTLIEDTLYLTTGSKFSTNTYTGFEYQPTGRLLWAIDNKRAAWVSVSRAVRTPNRVENDIELTFARFNRNGVPSRVVLFGNRGVESENLTAYEVGFRAHPTKQFSWDLATFYNQYDDLIVLPNRSPFFDSGQLIFPAVVANGMDGATYGVELSGTYEINENWRIRAWYSHLQIHLHKNFADNGRAEAPEGTSPQNQAYLMSSWNLGRDFEFDLMGRYVDRLPAVETAAYIAMDARFGWRPNDRWEFSLIGRNLLHRHHREFRDLDNTIQETEVERGVYAQAVLRY